MATRRQFLRQGLITTGGLVLLDPVSAFWKSNKPKVVIIGAGLSGLAAAHRLKQKGCEVTVLESRNRIGGRVFSHNLGKNHIVELGAEWIGHSHSRIIEMSESLGLTLHNNQMDTHLLYKGKYFPAGKWSYTEEWKNKFNRIIQDYHQYSEEDKLRLDQYDWWRFLVNNGCGGMDLDLRELLDSTDFGESIRHVSAFAALAEYAESSEKNEMDLKIKGGNQLLANRLAREVGLEHILLDHTVTEIHQEDKVSIRCAQGKIFEADKIICTIPTFSMTKIKWLPGLPEEKISSLHELQYARINKHVLYFKDRFWKDESFDMITDETPHYFYHATQHQQGPEGALIAYNIGDKAAVTANRDNAANALDIERTLQPHFGNIRDKIISQHNYYWGQDQYSMGAYALYGINQWFRIRPLLAAPFLHTHFAGEHLADWQGFMEGAVNTGEAAADQISA